MELLDEEKGNEALDFYCLKIIPEVLPIMREKFSKEFNQDYKYDGLISLLGFTPETVVLSYKFTEPSKTVVLYTKETKHILDAVVKYTSIPISDFHHEIFSEKPAISIYRAFDAALKKFPPKSRIAVELTGGKKTMSGALAVASGVLNIEVIYIDYSEYMPKYRKPKPSSSFIHLVHNPLNTSLDLFGSLELKKSIEFFNVGKYEASCALLEQLSERSPNPRIPKFCSELSRFYSLWNTFKFKEAEELSRSLLEDIQNFHSIIFSRINLDILSFQKQVDAIKKLSDNNKSYWILNFYYSVERYSKHEQNDISALLYYRTLEAIFDEALKSISTEFNRSKPDYSLLSENPDELLDKFNQVKNEIFKSDRQGISFPRTLGMFDSLCLLSSLDCSLCSKKFLKVQAENFFKGEYCLPVNGGDELPLPVLDRAGFEIAFISGGLTGDKEWNYLKTLLKKDIRRMDPASFYQRVSKGSENIRLAPSHNKHILFKVFSRRILLELRNEYDEPFEGTVEVFNKNRE